MYFFYFDESGTRDPEITGTRKDGSTFDKDTLYVLTAVGMYERKWLPFDRAISDLKLQLADRRHFRRQLHLHRNLQRIISRLLQFPARV